MLFLNIRLSTKTDNGFTPNRRRNNIHEVVIMKNKNIFKMSLIATVVAASPVISFADGADAVDLANAELSMVDAITIALDRQPGIAVEAELESDDGSLVWEISVLSEDDQVSEIEVDANTGVVLGASVEAD